ncbi:MAG: hypothetical protein AB1758_35780 [Candidatus Eremiobacterota bacterium]
MLDWTGFLGLERSDPLFEGRLNEVGEEPEIIDFGDELLVRFPDRGVALKAELGRVSSVSLYLAGDAEDDIQPYHGELPFGLAPGMSRDEVHRVLGEPQRVDGRRERYDLEGVACRVHFAEDAAVIEKVTLVHPEFVFQEP